MNVSADADDEPKILETPLDEEEVLSVHAGDRVLLNGVIYTARDQAHKKLVAALEAGRELPFDPAGQTIYYVGPSPAPPGKVIGSAGPTTSYRMDPFAPELYQAGVKATIGKGARSRGVRDAIERFKCLYLAAVGGAAALLGARVKSAEVIAYPELGTEAVRRLVVEDLPLIVVNDAYGGDLYENALQSAESSGGSGGATQ